VGHAPPCPPKFFGDTTSLLPVGFTGQFRPEWACSAPSAVAAKGMAVDQLLFRNSFIVTTLLVVSLLAPAPTLPGSTRCATKSFSQCYLIPNFILIRDLGWLDTFQGIIAPKFLMTPFAVFFLRQFFLTVNREVEEAAKIDGASLFGIFWRIVLPMSMALVAWVFSPSSPSGMIIYGRSW
jgi:ABC-type molybdate transport system permease subunit